MRKEEKTDKKRKRRRGKGEDRERRESTRGGKSLRKEDIIEGREGERGLRKRGRMRGRKIKE